MSKAISFFLKNEAVSKRRRSLKTEAIMLINKALASFVAQAKDQKLTLNETVNETLKDLYYVKSDNFNFIITNSV